MEDLLFKSEFYENIDYVRLLIGLALLLLLTKSMQVIYRRYSHSPTNKKSFSSIFILFSVSIFLIVTTIKSSLALSLGMVGALSIIRFRTAIKEPEQLIYFLGITGVAIAIAAEKEILAVLVVVIFVISAIINSKATKNPINQSIKYLTLNAKSKGKIGDSNFISDFLASGIDGGLQCKNYTEDSQGNINAIFTISDPSSLDIGKVRNTLAEMQFESYSYKMIN